MALDSPGQLELQQCLEDQRDGRAGLPDKFVQFHRAWPEQFQELLPKPLCLGLVR